MIRRVAFRKAVLAGTIGALGWEVVVRVLILVGVPLGDLVRLLGTMIAGNAPPVVWWPAGLALHALVGSVWAVFYAYFFWSTFDWPPPVQGLVFSCIPIVLAGLVMLPQLAVVHPLVLRGDIPWPDRSASDRLGRSSGDRPRSPDLCDRDLCDRAAVGCSGLVMAGGCSVSGGPCDGCNRSSSQGRLQKV